MCSRCSKAAKIAIVKCIPELESPNAAADCVGIFASPSFHPVAEAAPPADCATGSKAFTLAKRDPLLNPFKEAMIKRGFNSCTFSQPKPALVAAPGLIFSTKTSAFLSKSYIIF